MKPLPYLRYERILPHTPVRPRVGMFYALRVRRFDRRMERKAVKASRIADSVRRCAPDVLGPQWSDSR